MAASLHWGEGLHWPLKVKVGTTPVKWEESQVTFKGVANAHRTEVDTPLLFDPARSRAGNIT